VKNFQRKRESVPALNPDQLRQSYFLDNDISFINFCDLTQKDSLEILRWRNNPQVRKHMYQVDEISEAEHLSFIKHLPNQQKRFYWVVKENEKALGVIDIVDYHQDKSEWGFYLNPDYFGQGLSINLLFHSLNFFFKTLKFIGLYGYCHYKNTKGLLFHDLFDIRHIDYEQIQTKDNLSWYSKRVITGKNWILQNNNIESIKARKIMQKQFYQITCKRLELDQIILEEFGQSPKDFHLWKTSNSNLQYEKLSHHLKEIFTDSIKAKIPLRA
jgi:UDP-4-amino-4,6-dideoxy-N-acetyl-beta-L-altrosamine N-acetyltransferase